MDTTKLLENVNASLAKQFPTKHVEITLEDIERVYSRQVLGISADAKTRKGVKRGYLTGLLYLAPASLSGINICPKSSAGCRAACLFSAGRGRFYVTTRARVVKTMAMHLDTTRFIATIKTSIKSLVVKAKNKGLTPVVRLNGTSDLPFELTTDIIQSNSEVIFYDYSKIAKRFMFTIPSNYSLTFSLSESNESDARAVLARGGNVAVVFRTDQMPTTFWGYPVVSGDGDDLRFLDPKGVIVGLRAKGKAKKDISGFVQDMGESNYAQAA